MVTVRLIITVGGVKPELGVMLMRDTKLPAIPQVHPEVSLDVPCGNSKLKDEVLVVHQIDYKCDDEGTVEVNLKHSCFEDDEILLGAGEVREREINELLGAGWKRRFPHSFVADADKV